MNHFAHKMQSFSYPFLQQKRPFLTFSAFSEVLSGFVREGIKQGQYQQRWGHPYEGRER
jgi:hypothetical protein